MRKILITNDDGIDSEGLRRLVDVAKEFGEIWIVAPDGQRSACSHSITVHGTIDIYPYDFGVEGVKAFTCSQTPADCVRVGVRAIMPCKPDVVLSGINRGYNSATDIQYSGTVGAAFEAERHGVPAIAFSEGTGDDHSLTDQELPGILGMLINRKPSAGQVYNVNFPQCSPEECKGILEDRTVSRDGVYLERYRETDKLPNGGSRLRVNGIYNDRSKEGTDLRAVLDQYISISLIRNIC